MDASIPLLIGTLAGTGIFCLLRRSLVRAVFGLLLLSQAVNLMVFGAGGLAAGSPALVATGAKVPAAGHADPLPQALVLTAIVIGFGLVAFVLALLRDAWRATGHVDLDEFRGDGPESAPSVLTEKEGG